MSWVNLYKPPAPAAAPSDPYGPDPYDIHWPFSVHKHTLENDVVQLVPYIPRLYADAFWAKAEHEIGTILRFIPGSILTKADYLKSLDAFRSDSNSLMFVVVDKRSLPETGLKGAIAGQMALMRSDFNNLCTEIGFVITLPAYQRTHVTSNAVGLLLQYALNRPDDPVAPGLGMRRVEWRAHSMNLPSAATARRMGFVEEGVLQWQVVLAPGKEGLDPSEKDSLPERKGRHTRILGMTWDEWESRGRQHVEKQMQRHQEI
jgi:RimJ/RimL family protein N-acetyltransferase